MNRAVRVIPRLDIKGPNLVKGVHLEGLRVLGKPQSFARVYYQEGADELLFVDAVASLYGRNSLLDIIEETSREIFIPLTVAGGLRTLEDIREVLRRGADKVVLNSAAVANPELVRQASEAFGSSTVVVSIEYIQSAGGHEVLTHGGREVSGRNPFDWALEAVELGAGELLLTSIDREGTGTGYDIEVLRRISQVVPVPVIACGGAGKTDDLVQASVEGLADALSLASLLHYSYLPTVERLGEDFSGEGNLEFIKSNRSSRFPTVQMRELKRALVANGLGARL